jgi:hypothetical protein
MKSFGEFFGILVISSSGKREDHGLLELFRPLDRRMEVQAGGMSPTQTNDLQDPNQPENAGVG